MPRPRPRNSMVLHRRDRAREITSQAASSNGIPSGRMGAHSSVNGRETPRVPVSQLRISMNGRRATS